MTRVDVEATVPVPPEAAFEHFWAIDSLQQGWPLIADFAVIYDDGRHQEARMSVLRDGATEHIRIIRLRRGSDIEFFNPEPPPMTSFHRGAWRFRSSDEGCVITAEREYELRAREGETPEAFEARERAFRQALEERLGKILASVVGGKS